MMFPLHPAQPADTNKHPDNDVLTNIGYPSIWLVFLAYPAILMVTSDAAIETRVLGIAALVGFAVVYAASWWWTQPFASWGPTGNAFMWLVTLSLLLLPMIPVIGGNTMALGPFLVATLAFKLTPRLALLCVLPLVVLFILVAWQLGAPLTHWVPPMMVLSGFLMMGISALLDREHRATTMARDLDLARQRESIGRDVHDLLGHSLTVITLKTELARKILHRDPQRAATELDDILVLSRESLREVRATVGQLRTPEWSAQLASARTALRAARIDAKLPPPAIDIPDHHEPLLAWCLREAVTNVIRHSQATQCVVEAGPGHLVVTDDGVGISSPYTPGHGINGMTARVTEAGGTLNITPVTPDSPQPGTRLEVLLP